MSFAADRSKSASIVTGNAALVWPAPPDPPRIEYVRSFSEPADFGWKTSLWRKFVNWARAETEVNSLQRPFSVAVDGKGRILVADIGAHDVKIFDPQKKTMDRIRGFREKYFGAPVGVAVDDRDTIYVSDAASGRVLQFSSPGKLKGFIGGEEGAFKQPAGIAFNSVNHLIYIVDAMRPCIFAYSQEGKLVYQFGQRGDGPGQFNSPTFLAIDRAGRVYVNDTLNFRIQVFTPEGRLITQFGEEGDASGYFNRPKGVALDSEGHIYIAEAMFASVQIFDLEGRYLLSFGTEGQGPGEFYLPTSIAIDDANHIYVADTYHHRVQVFRYLPETRTSSDGRP